MILIIRLFLIMQNSDIPITVFKSEIFDTVADIRVSMLSVCPNERGYLYSKAKRTGLQ